MRYCLNLWLRVLVGSTGVFGGLLICGVLFWSLERFGVRGFAEMTSVLTWIVLAFIGIGVLIDHFIDKVTSNARVRSEFIRWYAQRRKADRP